MLPSMSPNTVSKKSSSIFIISRESVKKALGDGSDFGVKINYTLKKSRKFSELPEHSTMRVNLLEDDTFLIVNGKIITDIDISAAVETHKKSGAIATMVLKPNIKREKFTEVYTRRRISNRLRRFRASVYCRRNPRNTTNSTRR